MKIFNKDKTMEIFEDIRNLRGIFENEILDGEEVLVYTPYEIAEENPIMFETENIQETATQKQNIDDLKIELEGIMDWFVNNDWKCNKVFLGEWDINHYRFIEYKQERLIKRNRQDEIKQTLQNNTEEE